MLPADMAGGPDTTQPASPPAAAWPGSRGGMLAGMAAQRPVQAPAAVPATAVAQPADVPRPAGRGGMLAGMAAQRPVQAPAGPPSPLPPAAPPRQAETALPGGRFGMRPGTGTLRTAPPQILPRPQRHGGTGRDAHSAPQARPTAAAPLPPQPADRPAAAAPPLQAPRRATRDALVLPEIPVETGCGADAEQFEAVNAVQVRYVPMSTVNPTGAVIPSSMAAPTRRALERLAARVGDIDDWLCARLDWSRAELGDYLTSEQVDGVALALDSADRGEGLIIADQTGFGKGRIIAATARATILSGRPVIFMTEKANLFSDFWRDVRDIGSDALFGRPFMLNDAAKLVDTSAEDGRVLVSAWKKAEMDRVLKSGALPDGCLLMMATYSQFNRKGTRKSLFLEQVAAGTHIMLDEAHNFVGDSTTSVTVGNALSQASGSTFSSATFARDVTNLSAYSSVFPWLKRISGLDEMTPAQRRAIAEESVHLATDAGRIIRREHDLSNMVLRVKEDEARLARNEELADRLSPILSGMAKLARKVDMLLRERNEANEEARAAMLSAEERKAERELWFTANFGSRLNAVVSQFVVALLVDPCVDECVDTLLKGQKPVVVIESTMESLMRELSRDIDEGDAGRGEGDEPELPGLDAEDERAPETQPAEARPPTFRDALAIMCDRMLKVGVRRGTDFEKLPVAIREPEAVARDLATLRRDAATLPEDEARRRAAILDLEASLASSEFVAMQRGILELVTQFPNLSLSPIDDIRDKVEEAGKQLHASGRIARPWVADEISARGLRVVGGRYVPMPAQDRNKSVARFVNGGSQALVITRAASTGLSIHDSDKFSDHAQRHMIELKPPSNVVERIQTWGRVFRRGQRTEPLFTTLSTGLPFQVYSLAMQNRKVEELAASVTGSGRNGTTLKVDDPIDAVGNEVAHEFLMENQSLAERMGIPLNVDKEEADKEFYFVAKLLKRLPLLGRELQRRVFTAFMAAYADRLKTGAAHAARDLDGQWWPVKREVLEAGDGSDDPLTGGDVYVTTIRSQREARPMTSAAAQAQAAAATGRLGRSPFAAHIQALRDRREDVLKAALPRRFSSVQQALNAFESNSVKQASQKLANMAALLARLAPGIGARLPDDDGEPATAVILDIRAPDTARAMVAREYEIVYALPGDERPRTVSLDSLVREPRLSLGDADGAQRVFPAFDSAPRGSVEVQRKVLDGCGIGAVLASRRIGCGTRTSYRDQSGRVRRAILLPRAMENRLAGQPGRTTMPEVANAIFLGGGELKSNILNPDDGIIIRPDVRGGAVVRIPESKRAAKPWETAAMLSVTGPFEGGWRGREAKVPAHKVGMVIRLLGNMQTEFHYEARFRPLAVRMAHAAAASAAARDPDPCGFSGP
jgi:hypothetical protein